jgi:hypothetical protein
MAPKAAMKKQVQSLIVSLNASSAVACYDGTLLKCSCLRKHYTQLNANYPNAGDADPGQAGPGQQTLEHN